MKLFILDDILLDSRTQETIREEVKSSAIETAADEGKIADYSGLELDDTSELIGSVEMSDFLGEHEIEL